LTNLASAIISSQPIPSNSKSSSAAIEKANLFNSVGIPSVPLSIILKSRIATLAPELSLVTEFMLAEAELKEIVPLAAAPVVDAEVVPGEAGVT